MSPSLGISYCLCRSDRWVGFYHSFFLILDTICWRQGFRLCIKVLSTVYLNHHEKTQTIVNEHSGKWILPLESCVANLMIWQSLNGTTGQRRPRRTTFRPPNSQACLFAATQAHNSVLRRWRMLFPWMVTLHSKFFADLGRNWTKLSHSRLLRRLPCWIVLLHSWCGEVGHRTSLGSPSLFGGHCPSFLYQPESHQEPETTPLCLRGKLL